MRKRQVKKNKNKYLVIIADEAPLIMMTQEDRKQAYKEYEEFRERRAFRKKYKDLKNSKPLRYFYFFPPLNKHIKIGKPINYHTLAQLPSNELLDYFRSQGIEAISLDLNQNKTPDRINPFEQE